MAGHFGGTLSGLKLIPGKAFQDGSIVSRQIPTLAGSPGLKPKEGWLPSVQTQPSWFTRSKFTFLFTIGMNQ